ncbi:ATP-binding cassette domain-containing protein [Terrilactibacillus sp. S3-3]|nr:ATP-binding cassette domain-containing protein [Terrilactibacillus sp. S3-3]
MVCDIRVDNLQISFNGEKILDHLSFDVAAGEMFAIAGPNGAGKSTLLKAILGFITPQKGNVTIEKKGGKAVIGYVPQSRAIDEETPIRARDFVSLGLPPKIRPWLSSKERETVKRAMS